MLQIYYHYIYMSKLTTCLLHVFVSVDTMRGCGECVLQEKAAVVATGESASAAV